MSNKRNRNTARTNKTIHHARYNSIQIKIWIDICDFQAGVKAGQSAQERVPHGLIIDFCAWHYGYGIGLEYFEKKNNPK
ncbi:hypothetical protein AAKU61_003849 [Undibacterium sp. GrIS 1.2]|uniref:hypothetical protein n=1 Tax=Undibacterium sp. GrIS 1.2 TaxID=3143933 RepID=UPI003392ACE5